MGDGMKNVKVVEDNFRLYWEIRAMGYTHEQALRELKAIEGDV